MKNKIITIITTLLTPTLAIAQESEESVNPIVGILLLIFFAILCVITWFIEKPLINLLVKIFEEPPSPDRKKKRLTALLTIVVLIFSSFVILGSINYDAEPNTLLIIAAFTSIMIIGTTFWAPIMWLLGSFFYDRSWINKKKISKTRYLVFVAFGIPLFSYIMIMFLLILSGLGMFFIGENGFFR
ncbi:MAG: hypothetical protein IKS15_02775 [Opitutales bacterium]|nr:hypothetical protein [Opitutales bacterium]